MSESAISGRDIVVTMLSELIALAAVKSTFEFLIFWFSNLIIDESGRIIK